MGLFLYCEKMELLKKKVLLELHGVLLLMNVLILCMAREHVPSVNWVESTLNLVPSAPQFN